MRFDVIRARDKLSVKRSDASCDQVGVSEIANSNCTIEPLGDEIDEAIAVNSMDVKLRVTPRHFREHGGEVSWAERKRHSDSQATTAKPSQR